MGPNHSLLWVEACPALGYKISCQNHPNVDGGRVETKKKNRLGLRFRIGTSEPMTRVDDDDLTAKSS